MKASIIALSLISGVALAAPEAYGNGNWGKWGGKGKDCPKGPIPFTSTYSVTAYPDQVVNGTTPTGGQAGAIGYYEFGLNSDLNLICYNIKLVGLGDTGYQSPALTATHIHEAARGASGPPRIAFPNPQPLGNDRVSVGCIQGPFKTGVNGTDMVDTGAKFNVKQIEQNPCGFFADVHTVKAPTGAVRGQIA